MLRAQNVSGLSAYQASGDQLRDDADERDFVGLDGIILEI
jgi:hypothetical protein